MIADVTYLSKSHRIDLSSPIDISIPLRNKDQNPNAFYAPEVLFEPLIAGDYIGSIDAGSPVNFYNVHLNPHGNGTHTECAGHISNTGLTINQVLDNFFFAAQLVTIQPETIENGDEVITLEQVSGLLNTTFPTAFIIRTLPNTTDKLIRKYSGSNPPYLHYKAAEFLAEKNIQHLLLDLPSVDRAIDEGKTLAHKAFWQFPDRLRKGATITELIFVKKEVSDGLYFLNLQIASFELDVSPSKPVLYAIINP